MKWPFSKPAAPKADMEIEQDAPREEPRVFKVSAEAVAQSAEKAPSKVDIGGVEIKPYEPPPGVVPPGVSLAMDSVPWGYVQQTYGPSGLYFQGYPYLAVLAQRAEFRKISETIAREMTRKWIKVKCTGEEDKSDKITAIEKALKRFKVRQRFQKMAELDGFYGRGQLYIDLKAPKGGSIWRNPKELKRPLELDPVKIPQGSLLGFNAIEPVWTYPGSFNAEEPLKPDFYRPQLWYVMGKTVHRSRLLTFIGREVPDLLKAAYNFGGLSLSQMAEAYINNFLRTRDSVGDLVHSFSLTGLATDMSAVLTGGAATEMNNRAQLFQNTRDNRSLIMINKDTEEVFQHNTPLSGVSDLQGQAQEQLASVSGIPLVYLLGITPQGLNASSEGEIRVFEATIHAYQEHLFEEHMNTVLKVIQLSEFGEVDEEIGFEFVELREETPEERSSRHKNQADADSAYIAAGVVSPDEVRQKIANDPDSPYQGLEVDDEDDLDEREDDLEASASVQVK